MKIRGGKHLYELIASMNPTERRYFHLYANRNKLNGRNHYLSLFELIVSHLKAKAPFNEKSVKAEFLNISGKERFDLYKQHLYSRLLASLEDFHKPKNDVIKLRSLINQASLLNRRGLPNHALKVIGKAKDLCQSHERWYLLLELLELERQISYALQNPSLENTKELQVLQTVQLEGEIRNIQSQLWQTFLNNGLPTDEETRAKYSELKLNPALDKALNSESLVAKITRLYCLQFIAGMEGNIRSSYEHGKRLLKLMSDNPDHMSDKGELHLRSIMNWQYSQIRLDLKEELWGTIAMTRGLLSKYNLAPSFKNNIIASLFINEYDMLFKERSFDNLDLILKDLNKQLNLPAGQIASTTLLQIYWQNGVHCLIFENHTDIIEWTQKIRSLKSPYRQDIQVLSRILELIAHYELGNEQLLRSYMLNTYRYIKKKDRLLPIESFLIRSLKTLFFKNLDQALELRLKSILEDLSKVKKSSDSHESLILMYFEYWLSRKLKSSQ